MSQPQKEFPDLHIKINIIVTVSAPYFISVIVIYKDTCFLFIFYCVFLY